MELTARTAAGGDLVATAEWIADDLAGRAAAHDRDGSYPFESIDTLRDAGYFAAPVPEELGGLGVGSVHDVIVASGRLARGDASVAIGVNMHLVVVLNLLRRWQMARAAGNARREQAFAGSLRAIASRDIVMAAAMSEPGQDLTRPTTRAVRTETGWRIDGHKIFCTMAPAATVLLTSVRFVADDGGERYGYVEIPAGTPGVRINDDWDAMGMRASGSHSVTLDGVEMPAAALRGGFPTGDAAPYLERNLPSGLFHASASLGIAEAAFVRAARPERIGDDARARMLVAESVIDLATARAAISRAAGLIDDYHAANPTADGSDDEIIALFAEGQAAKTFVNDAATRVVDRALALSGGAGYLNGSPLARAYRDVRAGAFMHPLGANRAYEFLGNVALGREHELPLSVVVETVIIGAGQAGLVLSRHLRAAGHGHVVLERGRVGERWRSQRWDSLRLLTPNWLNGLPGAAPLPDPDGYLDREGVIAYLESYAADAPVRERTTVQRVRRTRHGYEVATDRGTWFARNVVIATGDCDVPRLPAAAAAVPPGVRSLHAARYRHPGELPDGGVLVVGAGPSGQQLAAELRRAGRDVVLAVGRHARMPRAYRGRDIFAWLDAIGQLDAHADDVPDLAAARRAPSFPVSGAAGGESLGLDRLAGLGVVVTGRLEGFTELHAVFSSGLERELRDADRRLGRTLAQIDAHIERTGAAAGPAEAPPPVSLGPAPARLELGTAFRTVLWATGYGRSYPWLDVPVLDDAGELIHREGVTPAPGLFALGLRFQRTRKSHFLSGVGEDAALVAEAIVAGARDARLPRAA